jgi:hypothetical protein
MKRPFASSDWEQEAAQLLTTANGPRMIVLDLDFTVRSHGILTMQF